VRCLGIASNPGRALNQIMPFTDIAVYAALFAAMGLVFVIHRVLSNHVQKREDRE
jgi:hypothetical protein